MKETGTPGAWRLHPLTSWLCWESSPGVGGVQRRLGYAKKFLKIMSQKWLQKSSNIYLQQAVPENLIPSKRLGKRERLRPKGRTLKDHYSRMERKICNQWAFSWKSSRRAMQQGGEPLLQAPLPRANCPHFPRKNLLSPTIHMLNHRISGAVGGNIVEHLNKLELATPKAGAGPTPYATHPTRKNLAVGQLVRPGEEPPRLENGGGDTMGKCGHTPYSIERGEGGTGSATAADVVCKQIDGRLWNALYSLHERGRIGARRDKINQDYKNQLTECRKIAMLYGNLSKRALVRTMRQARQAGGNVDSHFLSSLERRLDVALKRAFFFPTIKSARQWIRRGKILVNNQLVSAYSYSLQPADVISISPPAQTIWREQCAFFLARRTRAQRWRGGGGTPEKGDFLPLAEERRFPFSPPLMEKWKRWSKLWGNSPHPRESTLQHKWATNSATPAQSCSNYRGSSAFRYYAAPEWNSLESVSPIQWAYRRKTTTSRWLKSAVGRVMRPATPSTHAEWLHQQQSQVCDGLYAPRWSRVFAEKKPMARKMEDWRWSTLKPLHLECSYKHYSVIFLYAPQKLAWPCSINSAHLQKALV